MRTDMNSFEALCLLANKENWCWNLICTTCGHMNFRYSFKNIAKGIYPEDVNWTIHQNDHQALSMLGELPRTFDIETQEILIQIFSSVSLDRIATECKFPDWLGYLGLALNYTEAAERRNRTLTTKWIPQLLELTNEEHSAHKMLQDIYRDARRVLSWPDLEEVERALITY